MGFGRYPPEELYDLRTDPHYMKNVVSDPGYAKVREQMAEQLFAVLRKQKDPRIVEPDCRFERLPFTAGP
jgi:hypothetical protein